MKNRIWLCVFAFICIKLGAQNNIITTTLSVKGNCGDCKERIENAADIKGVKVCSWDAKTKVATITYNSQKTTLEKIEKAIAQAGYETQNQKANAAAYSKLPTCCRYNEGVCDEKK